jgi:hypothetical protein
LKLLFFGSLLVVVSVVAWAALDWAFEAAITPPSLFAPVEPVTRFVRTQPSPDAARPSSTIVWHTSTAPDDCAYVIHRRQRTEQQRLAELVSSATDLSMVREDADPCVPFELGQVDDGTKVEVVGDCGRMARVKIVSGNLRGRRGCIETDRLSELER